MPATITPATRLQILTLRGEGLSYPQIAEKTGVHHDTVMRTVKRANSHQITALECALAKREDILRRMSYIMQTAKEYRDSIAAAKLIAMMEGWLSPREEPQISINVVGTDISLLEREYAALKSPRTQSNGLVDTSPLPERTSLIVGQPSGSEANGVGAKNDEGGETPPGTDGNGF